MAGYSAPRQFDDLAPTEFVARIFYRVFERGRSKPLLVSASSGQDHLTQIVLKLLRPGDTSAPWRLCACRDLLGAMCARKAGLSTPDYGVVMVDQFFVESLVGTAEHPRLAANLGWNFGSVLIEPTLDVAPDEPDLWRDVLGFDAMMFNGDRTAENPNVLWDGETLLAIDHGLMAPTWAFDTQGYPDETLFGPGRIGSHAGYPYLRNRHAQYDKMRRQWPAELDDPFLDWAIHQIPASWADAVERGRLKTFVSRRLAIATAQAEELEGVLR